MNFPFLKEETFGLRQQVTFVGNKCDIYLPADYFNRLKPEIATARELGTHIETIGLFWFNVDGKWYELQLPLIFQFQFTDVTKKSMKIKPEFPEILYEVYTLRKGDAFVYDILHRKDVDDFGKVFFNKLIGNGKVPVTIKYSDSLPLFLNAMVATGVTNLNLSSVSIETILAEVYRNKKNTREPFRKVYNGLNEHDYKMVRFTKLPELNSTFTSIMGEDVNNQLVSSVLRHRENLPELESPLETLVKY